MGVETLKELDLDEPYVIEGFPGVGLVGKIAADHVSEELDAVYYGNCDCEGLPDISVFYEDDHFVKPAVTLMASEEHDVIVLEAEAPVSPEKAPCFSECVTKYIEEINGTPFYLSGLPVEGATENQERNVYGVTTKDDAGLVDHGIRPPNQDGVITGPTGSLMKEAKLSGLEAYGLIVESDPQFPDPTAARHLIEKGISSLTGIEFETDKLREKAGEIREKKGELAAKMKASDEDSSSAAPVGMYQ
ncbi:MAG: proteasome assembly chaperone family protein [Halobacteria archaeon]